MIKTKQFLEVTFFTVCAICLGSCSPAATVPTPSPTDTPSPTSTPEPTPTDSPPTISAEFLDMSQEERDEALLDATRKDDVVNIIGLLAAGADVNALDERVGFTPIMIATVRGNAETFTILLEEGANLDQIDKRKNTLLHHAAFENSTDIGLMLLSKSDIDLESRRQQFGFTPLLVAAFEGNVEMVELLLENGADIEAGDDWGDTAVNVAAWNGKLDVIEKLVAMGAIPIVENSNGNTALDHAKSQNHPDIEAFLSTVVEN